MSTGEVPVLSLHMSARMSSLFRFGATPFLILAPSSAIPSAPNRLALRSRCVSEGKDASLSSLLQRGLASRVFSW